MAAAKMTPSEALQAIKGWTVLELSEFIKLAEEEFGVSAAPVAMAAAMPAGGGGEAAEAEEEKVSFDVILVSPGEKKIPVIKVLREFTDLGLKEAKDVVDQAPKAVKEGVTKDEAEKIKARFEEEGATIEIK